MVVQYSSLGGSPLPYACLMPDLQPADPESLRLELQEAITTFRHQLGLLIQALGVIITADSILVAYGFSQRRSGILLVASLMPIAVVIIYFAIISGLIPITYVIMRIERELSLREESFMATWVLTRDDLPFKSMGNISKLDDPQIRESVLQAPPLYLFKDRKTLALLGAFIVQFTIFLISLTLYHYEFM
jgi:hypothetical protein